jgi:hypothetical protein
MTYCNTIVEYFAHKEAGFPSKKTLMCSYAAGVSGSRQWCRTSRQHFADTVCKIRGAVPTLLLSEKNVVRAEGLEPSWAV